MITDFSCATIELCFQGINQARILLQLSCFTIFFCFLVWYLFIQFLWFLNKFNLLTLEPFIKSFALQGGRGFLKSLYDDIFYESHNISSHYSFSIEFQLKLRTSWRDLLKISSVCLLPNCITMSCTDIKYFRITNMLATLVFPFKAMNLNVKGVGISSLHWASSLGRERSAI